MSPKLRKIFIPHEEVDSKSFQFLVNAIEKQANEDFDYLKFKQSLLALQAMDLDPATAIKSAFVTASTMGLTKDKLIKTAKFYKQVVNTEKVEFEKALEKQITDRVESRKQETNKLLSVIEQCEEQIKKLKEKIAECNERILSTDKDIADAESRILSSKEKFIKAYEHLTSEIEGDIETFQSTI